MESCRSRELFGVQALFRKFLTPSGETTTSVIDNKIIFINYVWIIRNRDQVTACVTSDLSSFPVTIQA